MVKLNLVSVFVFLLASMPAASAFAQVVSVDIGLNPSYEQASATTVTSTGGFFSGRVFVTNDGDYGAGSTLIWPGPASPQPLSVQPGLLIYQPASYSSLPALNAAFPTGTYTFSLTGGTQPDQTDTITYSVAADSNVAQLTGASYNAVQAAKAGQTLSIALTDAMAPSENANSSFVFLTLYDLSTGFNAVYSFQAPDISDTNFTIPGQYLVAGDQYELDTNFSDRITGSDSNSVPTTIFFDTHTDVLFGVAVPEPATWALMVAGVATLGGALRRRRTACLAAG